MLLLLASLLVLFIAFPDYPQTEMGWLLLLGFGSPTLLVMVAIDEWLKQTRPRLRPFVIIVVFIAWLATVFWLINHCIVTGK